MYQILLVVFLVVAIALVALILIQHGKGADMGASFGAGASNTVFGSSGSGNFLTRSTAVLAAIFFSVALALGYMTANQNKLAATSNSDIASQISSEQSAETPPVVDNELGIPNDDLEEVSIPAAEAISIPEDSTEDSVKENIKDTLEEKNEPPAASEDDNKQDDPKKDGGS